MFENHMLMNAIWAWAIAQVSKALLDWWISGKFHITRLWGDGGMPSCHSATVVSLAVTAAVENGMDSPIFAVTAILATIVMHDAMGVRLEAGKHAREINNLKELLDNLFPELNLGDMKSLKEFVGHTPYQVIVGGLLGLVVALVGCAIYQI